MTCDLMQTLIYVDCLLTVEGGQGKVAASDNETGLFSGTAKGCVSV